MIETTYKQETFSFPLDLSPDNSSLLVVDEGMREKLDRHFPPQEEMNLTKSRFEFVQNLVLGEKNVTGACPTYTLAAHRLFDELFNVQTTLVLLKDGKPSVYNGSPGFIMPSQAAIKCMDQRVQAVTYEQQSYWWLFHCVLQFKTPTQQYAVDLGSTKGPELWDTWIKDAWDPKYEGHWTPQTIQETSNATEFSSLLAKCPRPVPPISKTEISTWLIDRSRKFSIR